MGGILQQLLPWQHFEYFGVLKIVGVPQPKPIHGFSPNFHNILTERGSSADLVLGGIWQQLMAIL